MHHKHKEDHATWQQKITALEQEIKRNNDKYNKEMDQRAKQIAALDEMIVLKDEKNASMQNKLKEFNSKIEGTHHFSDIY